MASLAMLLKNRQNIAIKSWMNGERLRAGSVLLGPEACAEDQQGARRE
jgi:chemotaxis response regulator CheB